MKNLKIIVAIFIMAFMVSCGESSNPIEGIDIENEEIVLNEELKAGIQFDPSTIKVPGNFMGTVPGGQFIAIQTLINLQTPVLLIDENASVESISILDDRLYFTRAVGENDCGLPTDEYTQRYQWNYLDFSYTTEVGQNSDYNFWITEFKGQDDGEAVRVMVSGREKRGEEVSGCMFINSNNEANIKLEWRVSDGGLTEGETIFTYIVYDGDDKQVITMNIKPDGSGRSRVTEIIITTDTLEISETIIEDTQYFWTIDGVVTN